MNISAGILELLKRYGKVAVPEFGVFSTENSRAILDAGKKTILPPAKQIVFEEDYHIQDENLVDFLVSQKNSSRETVQFELKTQTDYWKNRLKNNEKFSVEGLGDFYWSENKLDFKGSRIQSESPDFYGLEEISLSEIKNNQNQDNETVYGERESYKFSNSFWWMFLLGIPVIGLIYFGITQQDLLFGKKSFGDTSIKDFIPKTEKRDAIKIDSLKQNTVADSVKQKTLKDSSTVYSTEKTRTSSKK